ncbi:Dolichyl-phosphate beta-glucosyltransferase-like 1 [Homarus americanus]|uniref:Dolichyl-phosphate beta-glucosyltransferase-like 1 n=1 Tax=Homarus americanus TaxID=6706 RepID=A0A8J5JWD2_HOMAM|nr:Dolichyl-phosphate beta-glucosyltransferase-like 1 [Homarus americanus]
MKIVYCVTMDFIILLTYLIGLAVVALLIAQVFCVIDSLNLSFIVPVMMEECMGYLEERAEQDSSFTYEVIIVDDGSKDKTTEVGMGYNKKYGCDKGILTLAKNKRVALSEW